MKKILFWAAAPAILLLAPGLWAGGCLAAAAGNTAFEEITGFREAWPPPAEKIEVYRPEEGKCSFGAYASSPDEQGIEVFDGPGGKLISSLPSAPDDPDLIMVTVTGFRGEWLSAEIYDGREVWLRAGFVEAGLRNYGPGDSSELRAGPGRQYAAIGDIYGDELVTILGGEGKWALIRYIDEANGEITGWTEAQNLCGHPYTTCP
ncbi:MAG: hypothetical protein ACOX5A_01575 [Aminivibrio sp.]|jgi:uncharacterized protein YgiM (DUF1202 family)